MLDSKKLEKFVQRFKKLIASGKLKRVDLTCSIDCLGPEQEYARYGLKVDTWIANFERLLQEPWLTLHVNQTISVLTIKTMPELIEKIKVWKSHREIGHFFSVVTPGPSWLAPNILGNAVFKQDFECILNAMPSSTNEDRLGIQYMEGIVHNYSQSQLDNTELLKLKTFLDEIDRRRGTNWPEVFPWLVKELEHVV
jgi:hypothetical protein